MSMKRTLEIARACHEANRAYCHLMGDDSQMPWDDAADWQKDSAIAGVQRFLDRPDVTPAEMHASWVGQKINDGWKFGPKKDPEKKEHPCIVPFGQLKPEQTFKDYLFLVVCKTFVKVYG